MILKNLVFFLKTRNTLEEYEYSKNCFEKKFRVTKFFPIIILEKINDTGFILLFLFLFRNKNSSYSIMRKFKIQKKLF